VETRKGEPPSQQDTLKFIRGLLDVEGLTYGPYEPRMIELLALASNIDVVNAFIIENGIFEKLDRLGKPQRPF
jgi:hypothetical protein